MVKKTRARARSRARARRHTRRLPVVERHHYYSKMAFDGKTIVSESQKDNEPVHRQVFTLKQLKREIPLAGRLVDEHLGGVIPEAMNRPIPKEIAFRSVLPNPADLGLLPPRESRRRFRTVRRKRQSTAATDAERENMRLVVNDIGDNDVGRRRDVFGLPF
jgi:hypothetical protein